MRLRSLLVALPLLTACPASHPPEGAVAAGGTAVEPLPPTAAAITVRDASGVAGPFRIAELQNLTVEVHVSGAQPGTHALRVDVVSPQGTVYAQLPITVEADANGAGTARQDLQVQGTPIEGLRQTGAWTVSAALDGADAPLATAEAQVVE